MCLVDDSSGVCVCRLGENKCVCMRAYVRVHWSFNFCRRLTGRIGRRARLSLPLHDLRDVINDCFVQKAQSFRADLVQQSLPPLTCTMTDHLTGPSFHSYHPVTEAEVKATFLKSNNQLILSHSILYRHHSVWN